MQMSDPQTVEPRIPDELLEAHSGWSWSQVSDYIPEVATWRIADHEGQVRYLKVGRRDLSITISEECFRMRWAPSHLPVPEVIDCGSNGEVEWLLTAELMGTVATSDEFKSDVGGLVAALGRGLRLFHSAPVEQCPFDFRIERALEIVGERVASGRVDPREDFHSEHAHFTLEEAFAELQRLAPDSEDLVVCHGDYCLPNVLMEAGQVVGFLDLTELGVADRWWDLAVGAWSVTWNLGPGWESNFLAAYGIVPDQQRIAFYRLLYDLVS